MLLEDLLADAVAPLADAPGQLGVEGLAGREVLDQGVGVGLGGRIGRPTPAGRGEVRPDRYTSGVPARPLMTHPWAKYRSRSWRPLWKAWAWAANDGQPLNRALARSSASSASTSLRKAPS